MKKTIAAALVIALSAHTAHGAMDVGSADFDKVVHESGKFSFVKFLAPW